MLVMLQMLKTPRMLETMQMLKTLKMLEMLEMLDSKQVENTYHYISELLYSRLLQFCSWASDVFTHTTGPSYSFLFWVRRNEEIFPASDSTWLLQGEIFWKALAQGPGALPTAAEALGPRRVPVKLCCLSKRMWSSRSCWQGLLAFLNLGSGWRARGQAGRQDASVC